MRGLITLSSEGGGGNATVSLTASIRPPQAFVNFWQQAIYPGASSVAFNNGTTRTTYVAPSLAGLYGQTVGCQLDFTGCALTMPNMLDIMAAFGPGNAGDYLFLSGANNPVFQEYAHVDASVTFNLTTAIAAALSAGETKALVITLSSGTFSIFLDPSGTSDNNFTGSDSFALFVLDGNAQGAATFISDNWTAFKSGFGGGVDAVSVSIVGSGDTVVFSDAQEFDFPWSISGTAVGATLVPGTALTINADIVALAVNDIHGNYNSSTTGVTSF